MTFNFDFSDDNSEATLKLATGGTLRMWFGTKDTVQEWYCESHDGVGDDGDKDIFMSVGGKLEAQVYCVLAIVRAAEEQWQEENRQLNIDIKNQRRHEASYALPR